MWFSFELWGGVCVMVCVWVREVLGLIMSDHTIDGQCHISLTCTLSIIHPFIPTSLLQLPRSKLACCSMYASVVILRHTHIHMFNTMQLNPHFRTFCDMPWHYTEVTDHGGERDCVRERTRKWFNINVMSVIHSLRAFEHRIELYPNSNEADYWSCVYYRALVHFEHRLSVLRVLHSQNQQNSVHWKYPDGALQTVQKNSVQRWTLLALNRRHLGYVAEKEEPFRQLFSTWVEKRVHFGRFCGCRE